MPGKKEHKPLSTKKPPAPNENHEIIIDWIANAKPALNPILTELDKQIRQQLKDPRYAIKWGKAYYGTPELGWCMELVAYDVSVNLVFLNGERLSQPPEVGGETRYVKIRTLGEAQSPQVLGWIHNSTQANGWEW